MLGCGRPATNIGIELSSPYDFYLSGWPMENRSDRWNTLLNETRRKPKAKSVDQTKLGINAPDFSTEPRTEIERDYDRILFSTPVRRLADKTQVFPLDKNDSVRTRLTHSVEVLAPHSTTIMALRPVCRMQPEICLQYLPPRDWSTI